MNISIDLSASGYTLEDLNNLNPEIVRAHKTLHNKTGLGNDYLGWLDYPANTDEEEMTRLKKCADKIREDSEVLLVTGIGGSYLGALSALKALTNSFFNEQSQGERGAPALYFIGNSISGTYLSHLLKLIKNKDISLNVISKSGTTTEPAIAFRILKQLMEDKYGKEEAAKRIYVTTDRNKGALKKLSEKMGYETFVIPEDIGGRYSFFTPVALLPLCAAGLDIDAILTGARDGMEEYSITDIKKNPCYQYAALRNMLLREGKNIELLVTYEPSLKYVSSWWTQLYGESEGKDGKGLYPSSAEYTTDLHSLGQYVQGGQRFLFETVLNIEEPELDLIIEEDPDNLDNLNYLAGKSMNYVNSRARDATILAHVDGGVPNIIINIPSLTPYYFGKLFYFFMKSCGISGYILDVNPFDQPGVEAYKQNMFALLDKPGFEELKSKLIERI